MSHRRTVETLAYEVNSLQMKIQNKSPTGDNITICDVIFANIAGRDIPAFPACALQAVEWRRLRIATVLCPTFRNIAFI